MVYDRKKAMRKKKGGKKRKGGKNGVALTSLRKQLESAQECTGRYCHN